MVGLISDNSVVTHKYTQIIYTRLHSVMNYLNKNTKTFLYRVGSLGNEVQWGWGWGGEGTLGSRAGVCDTYVK